MSVKPHKSFLFLLSVLTILLFVALLFPEKGIPIGKNARIQFITPKEIFKPQKENKEVGKDIEEIRKHSAEELAEQMEVEADTLQEKPPVKKWKRIYLKLQFPENNRAILHKAFEAFDHASNDSKPVRVLHYGDSQIEDDRITSYVRENLQRKFGGMGPGMIPIKPVYDYKPFVISQEISDNWTSHTLYWNKKKDSLLNHKRYGAMVGFSRFSPIATDSTFSKIERNAWISLKGVPRSYPKARYFRLCRLFYGQNQDPFSTEASINGEFVRRDSCLPAAFETLKWTSQEPVDNITLKFTGQSGPDIYGIALDGMNGIAVDNIPMRGNSGLIFTRMNSETLRRHYAELNIKMIILQFGGNIVPNVTDKYIRYYERRFYEEIKHLREILPDVAIVVIGVADMSIKEKTSYVSYPKLEEVRNAMKRASFKAGAAYWDMFEAMGGKNSMPSWVNEGLATSKDYVHLTPSGAKEIAKMFYAALLFEYNQYKKTIELEDTDQ